jgi:hypothetical protein
MCTVAVSLVPGDQVPLLLLGIRDEFTGRPWRPPGRHWPRSPLTGGIDEQAGGTWLAVHPGAPRVACILNGRGEFASPDRRQSRGGLPLRAAAEGHQALRELEHAPDTLARYDPFHLLCADLMGPDQAEALLLSWDGRDAVLTELAPGTHLLTNAGHMYPPTSANQVKPADDKAVRFGPEFAARRPSGDPDATLTEAWKDWLPLAEADLDRDGQPGDIIVRRELPDGRVYGTTSVSLVALARDNRLRYDFQPVPADPSTWYQVDTA